jgi:signal transduction histidine kinase
MNYRIVFEEKINNVSRILGIRFLYGLLIKPKSESEDMRRKEFVLNVILCGTLSLCFILGICIILSHIFPRDSYSGIPPMLFLGISSFFGFLLFLSRKGNIQTASSFLIGSYALVTLYGVYQWSFVPPMIILGVILTIVLSSILISTRFSFVLTVIIALIITVITWLQINDHIPLNLYWQSDPIVIKDVFEVSIIFFIISGLSWLSNRETEKSLARAIKSESDLVIERNKLEEKVEERTRSLKDLQAKQVHQLSHLADFGKLSAGIFHDLMNHLNAVVANIDRISSQETMVQETKSYLEKAVIASKRMANYLTTIRSTLKNNDLHAEFSPEREIIHAIDLLGHKTRIAQVTIICKHQPEIRIMGNALGFHQIALNLISNAIDSYTEIPDHGDRKIITTLQEANNTITFSVQDFGCGISENSLRNIFDPFYTTKNQKGLGVGLSTVKTVVENEFKGNISVTTTTGKGSMFCIIISKKPNHDSSHSYSD